MLFKDFDDEKFELIELSAFFFKHFRNQPLDWFNSVFAEFEKLRETINEKGGKS